MPSSTRKRRSTFETVNAENIIRYMSSDTRIGLVFLDACRDNPLSRRFQKKARSTAVGSGLATRTGSDPNLLIAFATAPAKWRWMAMAVTAPSPRR